jgi:hypothetical protein
MALKWVQGKRVGSEPDQLLSADELEAHVYAYCECECVAHLSMSEEVT